MNKRLITTLSGAVAALALAQSASANTITPSATGFLPGVSITYDARLTSGEIHAGDGFTIFDIGGFTGAIATPAGWVASVGAFGSPWGIAPLGADSALPNVTFTYTGAPIESVFVAVPFAPFVIGTTSTTVVTDDWTSRDHLLAKPGVIDGGVGAPHRDEILVPAPVPDGGMTALLLGLGFLGAAGVRRKLS